MQRYLKYVILIILISSSLTSKAQQIGFDFPNGENKMTIKFERYNNLIVIPLLINNIFTLKFILDTGVQYPIITEKSLADFLNFKYTRRIVIQSPGVTDSISALVAQGVSIKLPGGIKSGVNQSLLVLEEDYLELKKNLGANVYGIIGYSLFSRFVVEIDNDNMQIVLHEPSKFRPRKFMTKVPLKIVNTKPYVNVELFIKDSIKTSINMLIDTGASHAILLDEQSEGIFLPDKTIATIVGRGLGGDIEGVLGRVNCFSIDKYFFNNPISSFPTDGEYGNALLRGSRNGTIGSEILNRFNIIYDYSKSIMYMKKSHKYNDSFEHNMSGINLIVEDYQKGHMKVESLKIGSPAFIAGVQVGDIITEFNGYSIINSSFNHITSLLRQRDGKKISAKILRGEKHMKIAFKLKRVI